MSNGTGISQFRETPYTRGFVFVGQAFTASYTFTVAIGTTQWIQFSTGDKLVHSIDQRIVPNKGDVTFRMWEGSTITTPGSGAMPSVNMNRKSAKTSTATFTRDPVVSVNGTVIEELYMPGSADIGVHPGTNLPTSQAIEMIYNNNEDYIMEIINQSGEELKIQYTLTWYESGN